MPTRLYDETLSLSVGSIAVELRHADSILATAPYSGFQTDVCSSQAIHLRTRSRSWGSLTAVQAHLSSVRMLAALPVKRILPNHGAADIIAAGGLGLPSSRRRSTISRPFCVAGRSLRLPLSTFAISWRRISRPEQSPGTSPMPQFIAPMSKRCCLLQPNRRPVSALFGGSPDTDQRLLRLFVMRSAPIRFEHAMHEKEFIQLGTADLGSDKPDRVFPAVL